MFHEPLFVWLKKHLRLIVEVALGLIVTLTIFQDVLLTFFVCCFKNYEMFEQLNFFNFLLLR